MPLQWQNIPIPFGRGVDTKTEGKLVAPPFLSSLENGVFDAGGSIAKRNGYRALSRRVQGNRPDIAAGEALATYRGELLLFDGARAYTYSPSADIWVDKGAATSAIPSTSQVVRTDDNQTGPDCAYAGNIACYVYRRSGEVRLTIRDAVSQARYLTDALVAPGDAVKVVADSRGLFFCIFVRQADNLRVFRVPVRDPVTILGPTLPIANMAAGFDVSRAGQAYAVAYVPSEGTGIRLCYLTPTGQIAGRANNYPDPVSLFEDSGLGVCVALVPDGSGFAIAAVVGGKIEVRRLTAEFFETTFAAFFLGDASQMNQATSITLTATDVGYSVFYSHDDPLNPITTPVSASARLGRLLEPLDEVPPGKSLPPAWGVGLTLASTAWSYRGVGYVLCYLSSPVQPTYFVFTDSGILCSKHSGQIAGFRDAPYRLAQAAVLAEGRVAIAVLQRGRLASDAGQIYTLTSVAEARFDFVRSTRFATAELGGNLYVVGGMVLIYDGSVLVEDGFQAFPELTEAPVVAVGEGGQMSPGTRLYKLVYAKTDANGQVHRSATSLPTAVTAVDEANTSSTFIRCPKPLVTNRTGVSVEIYRTEADKTTYYLATPPTAPILVDKPLTDEQLTVVYHDTLSDAELSSRAVLYTTGGELDNDPPPAMRHIISTKQRLFGIPAEAPDSIWYTKEFDGTTGVGWSAALQQRAPSVGGDLECLGALDDKLVAFKRASIFALSGDGPTRSGLQDSFTPLQLVNTDCGCVEGDSLATTSDGLMFKSTKGIRLLDRSLAVQDVGGAVTGFNGNDVSSAVLLEDVNQIRFTCSDGPALVYDYYWRAPFSGTQIAVGQWSTFTGCEAVDAVSWKSRADESSNDAPTYVLLRANGLVLAETAGRYLDDGKFFPLRIETAWMPFAGNQGYFRCRRILLLGTFYSPHTLRVDLAYSYGDFNQQNQWATDKGIDIDFYGKSDPYGADALYGGRNEAVYQVRVNPSRQKCQSIKLRFSDVPRTAGTGGQSYSLSGMAFEVGMKKGLHKTGLSKQATR